MTLVNRLNDDLDAVVPPHAYRGFECRFTGLKGAQTDPGLAGQLIGGRTGGPYFCVVVPSGYVGPFEKGDQFHLGLTIPLIDLATDFEGTAQKVRQLLPARQEALHRLIDAHVDAEGEMVSR